MVIVWISLDHDRKKLDEFIAKNQLPGPHIFDEQGWDSGLAAHFNIRGIPMNYLLDREGKIVAKDLFEKQMREAVAAAVEGRKPKEATQAENE